MSPEHMPGKDALKNIPFIEIAVDRRSALGILTQMTRRGARKNLWRAQVGDISPDRTPKHQFALDSIDTIVEREISRGGRVMTEADVDTIYTKLGNLTFKQILGTKIDLLGSSLGSSDPRAIFQELNRGRFHIGYFLDSLDLVERENALQFFQEGAEVIIEDLNNHGITPYHMGYMLYPATHATPLSEKFSSGINTAELRVDIIGGEHFRRAYVIQPTLTTQEKGEFQTGERKAAAIWTEFSQGYSPN